MKKHNALFFLAFVTFNCVANEIRSSILYKPAGKIVIEALSQRSGLSEDELNNQIADCNVNQQSMYFCSYRDFVYSDIVMKEEKNRKIDAFVNCAKLINIKVAAWIRPNAAICESRATKEYGAGSLKETYKLACLAELTNSTALKINKISGCNKAKITYESLRHRK